MNFDKYEDTGTHWVALFCKRNEIVHLDSFGVEYIPEEIKDFIGNENIKANSFGIQANNSIMYGCYCIGFIDFILSGKKTDWFYWFVFFLSLWKKNDEIISVFPRMNECNSIEVDKKILTDQIKLKLNTDSKK